MRLRRLARGYDRGLLDRDAQNEARHVAVGVMFFVVGAGGVGREAQFGRDMEQDVAVEQPIAGALGEPRQIQGFPGIDRLCDRLPF